MSRADRRAAARALRGTKSIHLLGGPMDHWVVSPQAPALDPDWWRSWPDSVAERWSAGRYELIEGKGSDWDVQARWVEYQREAPSSGHGAVPELPQAGGEEG